VEADIFDMLQSAIALQVIPTLAFAAASLIQSPDVHACPIVENFTILPFESGSADLSMRTRRQLDAWREVIRDLQFPARMELIGNTDRVGTRRANLRLSFMRARAVRNYLVSGGIPGSLINIRAFGEDQPLVDTADEIPEAQNRIVQFLMMPDPREPRPLCDTESSLPAR